MTVLVPFLITHFPLRGIGGKYREITEKKEEKRKGTVARCDSGTDPWSHSSSPDTNHTFDLISVLNTAVMQTCGKTTDC